LTSINAPKAPGAENPRLFQFAVEEPVVGYRDILLYVGSNTATSTLIENAVNFAGEQNAHLTGLCVVDPPTIPGYVESDLPDEILESYRQSNLEHARRVEADFSDACETRGLKWAWRCVEGEPATVVLLNGRCVDLLVLAGGARRTPTNSSEIADRVVLECGRPVLGVPAGPMAKGAGSQIVIAWDGRREAVRAVHDALSLLCAAEWVKVVSVSPGGDAAGRGEIPAGDICRHLARHGVKAEAHIVDVRGRGIGETLLDWSADANANMIVMGAYGHSRWRELLLGGVTAHVLHEAQIPVLMSH
jgi:nucleotide-binding universal stress UspA family protein